MKCPIAYGAKHGGPGGAPFSDFDPATVIQEHIRLTAVQMRGGRVVDALNVEYEGAGGMRTHKHGDKDDRGGGSLGPRLSIGPDQSVINISGSAGANVDKLKILIGGGNSVEAGRDGGKPFADAPPDDAIVIGFRGRSGRYLDQIEMVYATFEPAVWKT